MENSGSGTDTQGLFVRQIGNIVSIQGYINTARRAVSYTHLLSMSAVFDGCSDFIISGCVPDGPRISPGYVWLGGKVRRFDGCADAVYPYYIYEIDVYKRQVLSSLNLESGKRYRHIMPRKKFLYLRNQ